MKIYFLYPNIIIYLMFLRSITTQSIVTGRCANSGIPPKATRYLITHERNRFDNGEQVKIKCENDGFDLPVEYLITCRNGQWNGTKARCGKRIDSNVNHLKINYCDQSEDSPQVSVPIVLSKWNSSVTVRNSFDEYRVPNTTKITLNGSICYTYKMGFDNKVTIGFLTIDIFKPNPGPENSPKLIPMVKLRDCTLQEMDRYPLINPIAFRYKYFCNLNTSYESMNSETNSIEFKLKTTTEEEIGLSAVYIWEVYKTSAGTPDCGNLRINNIGLDIQIDRGSQVISCNDSFYDLKEDNSSEISTNGNPKHKFFCDINGEWKGKCPICIPKKPCPNEKVMSGIDRSITIEEIGNVYFFNESQWFAINDSFNRYKCVDETNLMVGERVRVCLKNGIWNNKVPYCVRTGITSLSIVGILFGVLIIFVSIVLILFRINSKRVEKRLRETRDEIQTTNRNSNEIYSDIQFYPDHNVTYEEVNYSEVNKNQCENPEQNYYQTDFNYNNNQDYLVLQRYTVMKE